MGDKVNLIIKYLKKFILGGFLLYAYNLIAVAFNITLPINFFTMTTVCFFDIPGLVSLLIIKLIGL